MCYSAPCFSDKSDKDEPNESRGADGSRDGREAAYQRDARFNFLADGAIGSAAVVFAFPCDEGGRGKHNEAKKGADEQR